MPADPLAMDDETPAPARATEYSRASRRLYEQQVATLGPNVPQMMRGSVWLGTERELDMVEAKLRLRSSASRCRRPSPKARAHARVACTADRARYAQAHRGLGRGHCRPARRQRQVARDAGLARRDRCRGGALRIWRDATASVTRCSLLSAAWRWWIAAPADCVDYGNAAGDGL